MPVATQSISTDLIERKIYLIRGQKVMIDSDLAALYQVPTKSLNLGVRRNKIRFPEDFMFQLTLEEADGLRFQFETSSSGSHGGRRYLPYAFTQEGVAMLSSILRSDPRYPGEYRDHAHLRPASGDHGFAPGTGR